MGTVTSARDDPPRDADAADSVAALLAIQKCVHRWVDVIEDGLDGLNATPSDRADLQQAALDLERRKDAFRVEVERHEREWAERLEALEHDRRLLAEAWDQLERARITPAPPAAMAAAASPAPVPVASPPTAAWDGPGNAVDRVVMQQFEAFRRDVRRAAESRS